MSESVSPVPGPPSGGIDDPVAVGGDRPRADRAPFEARRTFAIISHPDAGKTTLTEHLLRESGAIHLAGQVKARGMRRRTRSDWMAIEQQRGISVTSSVMTFARDGLIFNLLDTPGHADFSEDTYRTLTAVDSAVMVLDAAKGIESQTLKLFEVCRLRDIPIVTFINKVDREGLDPLELLDEIASKLALDVSPMTWPVGMGVDFRGCLDLRSGRVTLNNGLPASIEWRDIDDLVRNEELLADSVYGPAFEGLQIARSSLPSFDLDTYRGGHQTPVFFGSALKGVGVSDLLSAIAEWAPAPRPQPADPEPISPAAPDVTGFVFKVQANMDRSHRDRIAFVRLCSGTFRRGMKLRNMRTGRDLTVANPVFFFAQERELADEAVAGDVVGIPNHGTLSVGDTLTEGRTVRVTGIPNFVGALQLDVLLSRIAAEYGVAVAFEDSGHATARWIASDKPGELKRFLASHQATVANDRSGAPVFLARSAWELQRVEKEWPEIAFTSTHERADAPRV